MVRVLVVIGGTGLRTAVTTLTDDADAAELLAEQYPSDSWRVAEIRDDGAVIRRFARGDEDWIEAP